MSLVSQSDLITGAIAGKVVSFPTDTVPALAVLPQQASLIFQLKARPTHKPLILMGASCEQLWPYVTGSPTELANWQQIAAQYWPGALTLIITRSPLVPSGMNPTNSGTIGIRVPNCPLTQSILAQTGPLATTSANRSGEAPLETMTAIARAFPEVLTLDCQNRGSGLPSTVAQWTGAGWEILRQGSLKL